MIGLKKYKKPLQILDERSGLVDAYQEALDLAVYLRKEIEERKEVEQGPSVARQASAKYGGRGVAQVTYTFHDDGRREVAFFTGKQVDDYSWHVHGMGPTWREALK